MYTQDFEKDLFTNALLTIHISALSTNLALRKQSCLELI